MPTNTKTADSEENPENREANPKEWRMTLAALCGAFEMSKSTLQDIIQRGGIRSEGGYPVLESGRLAIAHFRNLSETEASEAAKNRAKKEEALMDIAIMDRDEKAGKLADVEEVKRLLTSAIVRYREKIRQLPGLTLDQKKDVMEQLASLTLEEVEE